MRPPSHVTGDVGQTAVALAFKRWGWTADVCQSDYGEDLDVHVFADQQRTPLHFRCQVKSSADASKSVRRRKDGDFTIRLAASLCREWLLAYFPVLLVVYDDKNGQAYWVNATAAIRERMDTLSSKSLTLGVSTLDRLEGGRDRIAAQVSAFYAQLWRVQSERLERTVLPLLMPRYRCLTHCDMMRHEPRVSCRTITVSQRMLARDELPSWTAGLRSLNPHRLHALVFQAPNTEFATFAEGVHQSLEQSFEGLPTGPTEWIAFVCEPLRYSIEADTKSAAIFQRQLTGWNSYAYVGRRLVHDHDYAFLPPVGYIKQIGRRSRSWDGYFYVSADNDLCVQLIAGARSSPADVANPQVLRDHARAQYLPWRCQTADLPALELILREQDLAFRSIDDAAAVVETSGWTSGAICTALFEPGLGLIPQAETWREFESGSVQTRLVEAGLIGHLPGELGDAELHERLATMLNSVVRDAPSQWLVSGPDARRGLPLDLTDRRVIVQRLHEETAGPIDASIELETLAAELGQLGISENPIETSLSWMEGVFKRIVVLTAAWTPRLDHSSAESLERATPAIVRGFDQALPPTCSGRLTSSIDVLRMEGELYFEGDRMY